MTTLNDIEQKYIQQLRERTVHSRKSEDRMMQSIDVAVKALKAIGMSNLAKEIRNISTQ